MHINIIDSYTNTINSLITHQKSREQLKDKVHIKPDVLYIYVSTNINFRQGSHVVISKNLDNSENGTALCNKEHEEEDYQILRNNFIVLNYLGLRKPKRLL